MNADLRSLITQRAPGVNAAGCSFDPARLLRAIAIVESSGGENNVPRHEASWCPNMRGLVVQRKDGGLVTRGGANVSAISFQRFKLWGCSSCSSWSPFQIHAQTAMDRGFIGDPHDLGAPGVAIQYVIREINRLIDGPNQAKTVEQLADAWNSGSSRDSIIPAGYIAKIRTAYNTEDSHA